MNKAGKVQLVSNQLDVLCREEMSFEPESGIFSVTGWDAGCCGQDRRVGVIPHFGQDRASNGVANQHQIAGTVKHTKQCTLELV
jgi:hypothetical protein